MLETYPYLQNWVPGYYTAALRFLKIMGFKIDEPEPLGRRGVLFRRVYRER